MEGSTGNGIYIPSVCVQKSTRYVDVPVLDKEMLTKQNIVLNNYDSSFPTHVMFNAREENITNLPSPESTTGLIGTGNSPTMHAYLHPSNQPLAMAVAKIEQNYMQTRLMLQQCSRNVLLSVLLSLVDEYPTTFVEPIRARLEQQLTGRNNNPPSGMTNPTSNGGSGGLTGNNVSGRSAPSPNGSTTLWATQPPLPGGCNTSASSLYSVPSPSHRKGRGHRNKEDEQELCSVHHCMRVLKHLQLNPATGLYECVHGFHCLVDGPPAESVVAPLPPTASQTPVGKDGAGMGTGTGTGTGIGTEPLPQTPLHPYDNSQRRGSDAVSLRYSGVLTKETPKTGAGGAGEHPFGCSPLMKHFPTTDGSDTSIGMESQTNGGYSMEDPALDVNTLANLLKSVRALEGDE